MVERSVIKESMKVKIERTCRKIINTDRMKTPSACAGEAGNIRNRGTSSKESTKMMVPASVLFLRREETLTQSVAACNYKKVVASTHMSLNSNAPEKPSLLHAVRTIESGSLKYGVKFTLKVQCEDVQNAKSST